MKKYILLLAFVFVFNGTQISLGYPPETKFQTFMQNVLHPFKAKKKRKKSKVSCTPSKSTKKQRGLDKGRNHKRIRR